MADQATNPPVSFTTESGERYTLWLTAAVPSKYHPMAEEAKLVHFATESDLAAAGFVRASRLAAAEAEVERGMGIAQGQQVGYEVQLSTARSRITELEAHVSLQREAVETGQRYVSEMESKLAAAEAMVEDARKLELGLQDVLQKAWDGDVYRSERIDGVDLKFLSSRLFDYRVSCARVRPSEQASKEDSEVPACPECRSRERAYRREMPRGAGWAPCSHTWHQDSNAAGAGSANVSGTSGVAPAVENTGHLLTRLSELSLSLGRVEGEADGHRMQRECAERRVQDLGDERDELKAKLEAAEASLAEVKESRRRRQRSKQVKP